MVLSRGSLGMKTALLSFSSALVLPFVLVLSPPASAEVRQDTAVVAIAAPTSLSGTGERTAMVSLQPTAAPAEQQRAEAAAAADSPEPGWRERLALLGAAFLALLFILRRQLTQRLGESPGRGRLSQRPSARSGRYEPAVDTPENTGFTLSEFDNLPPSELPLDAPANADVDGDINAATNTTGHAADSAAPRRRLRHTLQRKPPVARRKARWPARLRPPEA